MGVGGGDGTDGEEGEVGGHPPPSHNKNMLGQNFSLYSHRTGLFLGD